MAYFRICMLFIFCLFPWQALAADKPLTYAVAPFSINGPEQYAYLSKGIQDMMVSRMARDRKLINGAKTRPGKVPDSRAVAESMHKSYGTDYFVYGSVTILGDNCSVDVHALGPEGKNWSVNDQVPVSGLIPSLEQAARKISSKAFALPEPVQPLVVQQPKAKGPANQAFIQNEVDGVRQSSVNPQFRYEGGSQTPGIWRSPRLKFASHAMVAADLDGDGITEAVLASENTLYVYRITTSDMQLVAEHRFGTQAKILNLNIVDVDRDGYKEICVSNMHNERPRSAVLNFKNSKLEVKTKSLNFYMNVLSMPPGFVLTLVGHRPDMNNKLSENIRLVKPVGGSYELGARITVPEHGNIFNFNYLPEKDGDYKVIMVDSLEQLKTFSSKLELLHTTEEQYAGSAIRLEIPDNLPGTGSSDNTFKYSFYIPLRLIHTDMDKDGVNELLVSKNITALGSVFGSFRTFTQGEIHAMFWDGVGLNLAWKTRRIKGTVSDYGLADLNNDGKLDLYVCLNTVSSGLNLSKRKTIIIAYTLETGESDGQ